MRPPALSDPEDRLQRDVVWIGRPDGSAHPMHMSANMCAIGVEAATLLQDVFALGREGALKRLAARDGTPVEEAKGEVEQFLRDLRREGSIQPVLPAAPDSSRERVARGLLRAAVRLTDGVARSRRARTRMLL